MFVKNQLDFVQCQFISKLTVDKVMIVDRKESIKCDADIYSKYKGYAMYQK